MKNPLISLKEVHLGINEKAGYATVKRTLHSLLSIDLSWKSSQIEGNTYSLL